MLSRAFTIAVEEWEWLDHKPFLKIKKEAGKQCTGEIPDTGRRKDDLLRTVLNGLKDLVVFSLHTGLRQHEQLSLTWDRVSLLRRDYSYSGNKEW